MVNGIEWLPVAQLFCYSCSNVIEIPFHPGTLYKVPAQYTTAIETLSAKRNEQTHDKQTNERKMRKIGLREKWIK